MPTTESNPNYQDVFFLLPGARTDEEDGVWEETLSPGKEKKAPHVLHTYHLCFLDGSESWSLLGGNTDTAREQGMPSKS